MAEPSNIRVNPFTGTGGATNYVELTEKHIIPANSPYVIRLNEVPEKQDPSNMKMVYVDSATGDATENTLTEVAATPGQREFRPDYSTNALDDKTWNTGLIEFSASDAGKIVQVTYTGTGTLAGVTSNHWPSWYTDRGDGSDGDFVPTENTTISGVKNYKSVFIKSGITITVDKYVLIKCLGAFVNEGTITSAGKAGNGAVNGDTANYSTNGSVGGAGGTGGNTSSTGAGGSGKFQGYPVDNTALKTIALDVLHGLAVGAGGGYTNAGAGGAGGGAVVVVANSIKNNVINCNGANGANGVFVNGPIRDSYYAGAGGGGGGTAVLIANSITKGTVTANGGTGGSSPGGGATVGGNGGEGIVKIISLGV